MPRAYLGVTVPGFPNLFLLYGPNTNGGTGSVVATIESSIAPRAGRAAASCERAGAATIEVRREAADAFDAELRAALAAHRLAHGLHELVRRRARQRPEPVALVMVEPTAAARPAWTRAAYALS